MSDVNAMVLTGFGLNCDLETAHALELAGARAQRTHINALIEDPGRLDNCHILVFGGGFSWGDDHGAGVLQAVRLKTHIGDQVLSFIDAGNLVMGICNGFQTLANFGLLPGLDGRYTDRCVALTANDCGNFRDQWVELKINPASPCVFTRGLDHITLPVRHGEGKFTAADEIIDRLFRRKLVVMQYADDRGGPAGGAFPHNPNGSLGDIAGICDPSGRVFGLMPHPEAYNHFANHPDWTLERRRRLRAGESPPSPQGLGVQLFKNAVAYISGSR